MPSASHRQEASRHLCDSLHQLIEQTADVFRRVFGDDNIVEHHSNVESSPEAETHRSRLACENWDAPLVVTTNVQLFESLFARRTSRCRKLHSFSRNLSCDGTRPGGESCRWRGSMSQIAVPPPWSMDARFKALVQNSADIITIHDANGITTFESPSAACALGRPHRMLVGRSAFESILPRQGTCTRSFQRRRRWHGAPRSGRSLLPPCQRL